MNAKLLIILVLGLAAAGLQDAEHSPCAKLAEPSHVHLSIPETKLTMCLTLAAGWLQRITRSDDPGLQWTAPGGKGWLAIDCSSVPAFVTRDPLLEQTDQLIRDYGRRRTNEGNSVCGRKHLQVGGCEAERVDVKTPVGNVLRNVLVVQGKTCLHLTFSGDGDDADADRALDALLASVRFW